MKTFASVIVCASIGTGLFAAGKLTFDDQVELVRGLTAENAKLKTFLPRSKKALEFDSAGTWDKQAWLNAGEKLGPAARVGDTIQITKVTLENDKIKRPSHYLVTRLCRALRRKPEDLFPVALAS